MKIKSFSFRRWVSVPFAVSINTPLISCPSISTVISVEFARRCGHPSICATSVMAQLRMLMLSPFLIPDTAITLCFVAIEMTEFIKSIILSYSFGFSSKRALTSSADFPIPSSHASFVTLSFISGKFFCSLVTVFFQI